MYKSLLRWSIILAGCVAVAAPMAAVKTRVQRLDEQAATHARLEREALRSAELGYGENRQAWLRIAEYHRALVPKYERASQSPWRAVDPDPPEPNEDAPFTYIGDPPSAGAVVQPVSRP